MALRGRSVESFPTTHQKLHKKDYNCSLKHHRIWRTLLKNRWWDILRASNTHTVWIYEYVLTLITKFCLMH